MIFLYNIFISLYTLAAKILSIKNTKAKLWVDGRKGILNELRQAFLNNNAKVIWVHCASLGEFEQARPIIEEIAERNKATESQYKILLTFFSPSGFEIQKKYDKVDRVFYLPPDTKENVKEFYKIVNPDLIIFVKYEFWYYYFNQAAQLKIPLIVVSAIFRNNQPFFKWYGNLHRQMLKCVNHFFVQNNSSKVLLNSININNVTVSGDSRFDRVLDLSAVPFSNKKIEDFIGHSQVIVAGSTWTEDDEELDHFANANPDIKFVIAPHEINPERLNECLHLYKNSVLFSCIERTQKNTNVLIIDNVGMLSKLYRYATVAYVGGGFGGDGVHNVLEPAVYAKPVVFGPVYDKFIEAQEIIESGGGISVENALELESALKKLLTDLSYYNTCSNNAKEYVVSNAGATAKVIDYIYANLLRTTL